MIFKRKKNFQNDSLVLKICDSFVEFESFSSLIEWIHKFLIQRTEMMINSKKKRKIREN